MITSYSVPFFVSMAGNFDNNAGVLTNHIRFNFQKEMDELLLHFFNYCKDS